MCLPLAAAAAAVTIASTMASFAAQQNQAKAQSQANAYATQQMQNAADQRRMDGERQANEQSQQDASAAMQYQQDAMRQRASLDTLIGEYGGGNTGDRRLATLDMRQGQDYATLANNATRNQQEIGLSTAADMTSIRSGVNSLPSVQRPSLVGLGASLAGSYLTFKGRQEAMDNYGGTAREMQYRHDRNASLGMAYLNGRGGIGD